MNFFRWLFIHLCNVLYQLIPPLYRLFYDLASATFFQQDVIKSFSKNIYVLLSVVMLFAFAIKALESIVNPELLFDSKKGFTGVLKRSLIALLLIVIIPFAFDKFYEYQSEIMSKNLIEKMILGVNIDGGSGNNTADKTGAGQMMAGLALQSVLYLNEDAAAYEDMQATIDAYDSAISEDISNLKDVAPDINEKYDKDGKEECIFEFHWLLAIVGAVFIIYLFFLFCLDTAERVIRLGFLQLTAPISVIAYVYGGNDILKNWSSETAKTAFSVFLRIAGLAFLIFVLANINDFTDSITDEKGVYKALIILLVLIGTLMFIKEVPKFTEKVFGVSIGGKGGLKGRLGNMAGADVAKKALGAMTLGAAAVGGAVGGAMLAGGKALGYTAANKFDKFANSELGQKLKAKSDNFKSKPFGKFVSGAADKISGAAKGVANRIPAVGKAVKSGVEAGGGFKGLKSAKEAYEGSKQIKNQRLQEGEKFDNSIGIRDGVVLGKNNTLAEAGKDNTRGHYSLNELMNKLSKEYGIPKDVLRDRINTALQKESIEGFQKAHSDVQDLLGEEIQNASANGNTELVQKLQDLQKNFKGGKLSTSDINREIKNLYNKGKIGSGSHNDIIGKLNTIDNMLENDKYIQSLGLVNEDGGIAGAAITTAVNAATGAFNRAEEKYKVAHENSSPSNQTKMDRYKEASDIIAKQYAFENGKPQGNNTDHYEKVEGVISSSDASETGNARVIKVSKKSQQKGLESISTPVNGGHAGYTTESADASETSSARVIEVSKEGQQGLESISTPVNGGHAEHTTARDDAYRNMNQSSVNSSPANPIPSGTSSVPDGTNIPSSQNMSSENNTLNNFFNNSQTPDLSGLESTLNRMVDDINSNTNKASDGINSNINQTRSDINSNINQSRNDINSNISAAQRETFNNLKKVQDNITNEIDENKVDPYNHKTDNSWGDDE